MKLTAKKLDKLSYGTTGLSNGEPCLNYEPVFLQVINWYENWRGSNCERRKGHLTARRCDRLGILTGIKKL